VVEDDLTVLLSSHNVSELERVCDHLVLVADGRVQLAGDIDDLLDSHKLLTGPGTDVPDGPEVIHVDRADRHAHVVARIGAARPMPGWEPHAVSLEDLVLAYLRRAQRETRPAHDAKVVHS
jgi:ABC-2 type transport system ATP-binding protein